MVGLKESKKAANSDKKKVVVLAVKMVDHWGKQWAGLMGEKKAGSKEGWKADCLALKLAVWMDETMVEYLVYL